MPTENLDPDVCNCTDCKKYRHQNIQRWENPHQITPGKLLVAGCTGLGVIVALIWLSSVVCVMAGGSVITCGM